MDHEFDHEQAGGAGSAERLPPHSAEAERGVLGCCLLEVRSVGQVRESIQDLRVWYDLRHETVWRALVAMAGEGQPVTDLVLVCQRLRDAGTLEQVGGVAYLNSLVDGVPSAGNLSFYLEIVWEKFTARELLRVAVEAGSQLYGPNGLPGLVLARMKERVELIERRAQRVQNVAPTELKRPAEFIEEVERRMFRLGGNELPGLDLPIEFVLKVRPKESTLVTGDDGSGKSTLLMWFLLHLALQGEVVLIASFEMPRDVTVWMLVSMLLGRQRLEDCDADRRRWAQVMAWVNKHFVIFDFLGIGDWRVLLEVARYGVRYLGVTQVLVDSVMRIGIADDDYAGQAFCAAAFAGLAMSEECHLWHVIHENKGEGKGKAKIRGSKLWSANACNVLRVERNMKKGEELGKLEQELWAERRATTPDQGEVSQLEGKIEKKRMEWDTCMVLQKQRYPGSRQNGVKRFWFDVGCFQFRGDWRDPAEDLWERKKRREKGTEGGE